MQNIGAAVGIDLGSQNSVIAAVMRRGIDIILNQSSTRSSPTLVGYTKQERLAGIPASNQIKANFKNTIQYPSRFLGVPSSSPQAQIQSSFIPNKLTEDGNKIVFNVQHQGQALQLYPEQIVGCYLQKLRQFLLIKNIQTKDVVITVPSYFTAIQRQCMLDACDIAGLNCQKLINESSAITYAYGLFRKDDFTSKSRYVVFVDLGHAKCTVTISSFTKDKGKIVAQFSERNLGARNFDAKLMNVLSDKFNSQFGCDPRSSPKCRLRMLDFIEKARKILSGNTETDILIESLMEDQDLQFHLTRADFESLIQDELKAFVSVMQSAFELSGLKKESIHSVELVGDATRIPKVKELAQQFFGKQSSRTLNSAQCVARGAAIQAAMLSPLFKVSDFVLHDYNPYDVTVSWSIIEQPDQKDTQPAAEGQGFKQKKLFKKGANYPNVLALTFDKRKEKLDLAIQYSNQTDVLQGMPTQIAQYSIPNQKPKKQNFSMVIKVMVDLNGIPRMQMAQMVEQYQVQNKIPMKKMPKQKKEQKKDQSQKKGDENEGQKNKEEEQNNAPSENDQKDKSNNTEQQQKKPQQTAKTQEKNDQAPPKQEIEYETKIVQKETRSKIKHVFSQHGMDTNLLKKCQEAEGKFLEFDNQITNLKSFKNDLEAYVYDMRGKIVESGELANYVDEKVSAEFLHHLNQTQEWLYGEGKNTTLEEYQKKSELLREYGDPIVNRFRQFTALEYELAQLDQIALKQQQNIDQIDLAKEGQHITQEEKNKAYQMTEQLRVKMSEIHLALQGDRRLNSQVELKNAIKWKQSYQTEVNKIINKPLPPKPRQKDKSKDDKGDDDKGDKQNGQKKEESEKKNQGQPAPNVNQNQDDIAADLD